jgi:anti-anti-sigma factor
MSELAHQSPTPGGLNVFPTERNGRVVLHALGDLDAGTANRLIVAVCEALEDHHSVELDLGGITFMDAAGLGALMACAESANDHGWDFFVSGESAAIRRVTTAVPAADRLLHRLLGRRDAA